MSGFFFSNTSSEAPSSGYHFGDDEPATFGNTAAAPDFQMEWDTDASPNSMLWTSALNAELNWAPTADQTSGALIRFFDVSPVVTADSANSNAYSASRFFVTTAGTANFTNTGNALQSAIFQVTHAGSGNATTIKPTSYTVVNSGGGTVDKAVGTSITLRNTSGTITEGVGVEFLDVGGTLPTTVAAFNFESSYISNSRAVSIQDDGVQAYIPITTDDGFVEVPATAGITASSTQTQGQQPLTTQLNEVSTVAGANDVVTLPSAVAGREITIINNGANVLQIFPASGDDLGAGVDLPNTLASGSNINYIAYNGTNWETK